MPSSSPSDDDRRAYPDSSETDWGRGSALGGTYSHTRRSYDFDGCSCLDVDAMRVRSDGGLKSAEELPPGRYAVWE